MTVLPFKPKKAKPKAPPRRLKNRAGGGVVRERRMHLALSEEEENVLATLARAKGVSRSDYLRLALKAAHHRGDV